MNGLLFSGEYRFVDARLGGNFRVGQFVKRLVRRTHNEKPWQWAVQKWKQRDVEKEVGFSEDNDARDRVLRLEIQSENVSSERTRRDTAIGGKKAEEESFVERISVDGRGASSKFISRYKRDVTSRTVGPENISR